MKGKFLKPVLTASALAEVEGMQQVLQDAGVPCEVRRTGTADASGFQSDGFELWVKRDRDYARARVLRDAWSRSVVASAV